MLKWYQNPLSTIDENTNYNGSRNDRPLREIFSKNHISALTYCKKNKKVENIERSYKHLNRSQFTQNLIDLIKEDFVNDLEITKILDELPLSGSENQDRKLIEIAFELCHAKIEESTNTHLEIEKTNLGINSNFKNSIKEKIQNLHKNKDDFDFFDQFCRTGEDVLNLSVTALTEILIFPFEICLGKDKEKSIQPKTSIIYINKTNFSESKQL